MAKEPDPDVLTDPYAGGRGRRRDDPPRSDPPSSGPPSSEAPESSTHTPGSPVAHGRGLPPNKKPRARRRRRLRLARALRWMAIAIASLAALAGVSFAAWKWGLPLLAKQRETSLFPMGDAAFLPPDFTVLQRWEDLETKGIDVYDEARWSYFSANFCGGGDIFRALAQSDRAGGRGDVASAMRSPRAERDSLRCGRALAESAEREVFVLHVSVPFEPATPSEAEGPQRASSEGVVLVEASIEDAPASQREFRFATERLGLGEVRCLLQGSSAPTCSNAASASAHLEASPFWVGGTLRSIERVGRGVSLTKGNEHADAEELARVAERAPRAKRMSIGRGAFLNTDYLALLGVPEATGLEELRRGLAERQTVYAESDDTTYAGGTYVLTLLLEGDADALDAEEHLRKAHAATLGSDPRPKQSSVEPLAVRFDEAQRAAAMRAIRGVTIERDGRWLTATYEVELSESEAETVETWRARYNERRRAAAAIVRRVHDGEPIPNELWVAAGGTELMNRVLGSRERD